jgi:Tfp pilus assembly protein PilN
MIRINLIPPEYVERLNRRAIIAKAVAAGVAAAAVVVMLSLWHFTSAKTSEMKMNRLSLELKSLQADVDRAKKIEADIAEVKRYLSSIDSITRGRLLYPRFMQDITSALPGTMWLGNITTTLSGSGLTVNMAVFSRSAYDLAYWINALETDGKYSTVTVGAISVSGLDADKIINTPLTLAYAYK